MAAHTSLSGVERFFDDDELIVTKTDLSGRMVYCNDVFLRIAGYRESECLGHQHNLIRHPDMPRCVFKLLWDTIADGREIFAYVINRASNGDHYWVFAHVTPSFDPTGAIAGYHSTRRVVVRGIVEQAIIPLYRELLTEERSHDSKREGMAAGTGMLVDKLQTVGVDYDRFVAGL